MVELAQRKSLAESPGEEAPNKGASCPEMKCGHALVDVVRVHFLKRAGGDRLEARLGAVQLGGGNPGRGITTCGGGNGSATERYLSRWGVRPREVHRGESDKAYGRVRKIARTVRDGEGWVKLGSKN